MKPNDVRINGLYVTESGTETKMSFIVRVLSRSKRGQRGAYDIEVMWPWPCNDANLIVLYPSDLQPLDPAWLGRKYKELVLIIEEYKEKIK